MPGDNFYPPEHPLSPAGAWVRALPAKPSLPDRERFLPSPAIRPTSPISFQAIPAHRSAHLSKVLISDILSAGYLPHALRQKSPLPLRDDNAFRQKTSESDFPHSVHSPGRIPVALYEYVLEPYKRSVREKPPVTRIPVRLSLCVHYNPFLQSPNR